MKKSIYFRLDKIKYNLKCFDLKDQRGGVQFKDKCHKPLYIITNKHNKILMLLELPDSYVLCLVYIHLWDLLCGFALTGLVLITTFILLLSFGCAFARRGRALRRWRLNFGFRFV